MMGQKAKRDKLMFEAAELMDIRDLMKKRLLKMERKKCANKEALENLRRNYAQIVNRKKKLTEYIEKISRKIE